MRTLTAADAELLHELWAGTLFDIIHAVDEKRPLWTEEEQAALVAMVIEELYGLVEEHADHQSGV